jgi:MoaA/NifB/PqqE/SkfB family radical SAM enzyme
LETPQYPENVHPELSRACNLTCIMCPAHSPTSNPRMVRDYPAYMDLLKFYTIMEQTRNFGVLCVGPQIYGEPLLHPELFDAIAFARNLGHEVDVNTNGMLLDKEAAAKLLKLGVRTFCISVDGADKEIVEKIRLGCDFVRVLGNVEQMIDLRSRMGHTKTQIMISMCDHVLNHQHISRAVDFWLDKGVDKVLVNNNLRSGERTWNFLPKDRWPCPYLWKEMGIYTNGEVVSCRGDVGSTLVAGNAFTTSLLDIWHGEFLEKLRTLHNDGKWGRIPECAGCLDWARFTGATITHNDGKVYETSAFTTTIYKQTPTKYATALGKRWASGLLRKVRG